MKDLDSIFVKQEQTSVKFVECKLENCKICNLEQYLDINWQNHIGKDKVLLHLNPVKNVLHKEEKEFFPKPQLVFMAFNLCHLENIKVVIIGQDPYHNPGQAHGMAFSVSQNARVPPSLKNIYKELKNDICGFKDPKHGNLQGWAQQGVLLLNDILTVVKNTPSSHSRIGWKEFTTNILQIINEKTENVVFMLWGNHAKQKSVLIDKNKHLVLEAGHPSPFSVKYFIGCKHFSTANKYLDDNGKQQINWNEL